MKAVLTSINKILAYMYANNNHSRIYSLTIAPKQLIENSLSFLANVLNNAFFSEMKR